MFTRIGELQIEPKTGKIWFNNANTGECLVRIWTKPIEINNNIMPMLDLIDFRIKRSDINSDSATTDCIFILSSGTVQPNDINDWWYDSDSDVLYSNKIDKSDFIDMKFEKIEDYEFNDEQALEDDEAHIIWNPQMIFGSRQEANEYVQSNKHHFGKCRKDIDYQIYGVPAKGFLAGLLIQSDK